MERFGEKLRILREQHGLTQRQLAEQFGFQKAFVGALEHGRKKPSASLVLKIAHFFDVTTDTLMQDTIELDEHG
jgi:transcriptional regulator with XRE-family HTH domain